MLENAAESPASGARFVRCVRIEQDLPPKNQNPAFHWLDFTRDTNFYKPDFAIETEHELEERQIPGLAETYAEKLTLRKVNFAKTNELDEKA